MTILSSGLSALASDTNFNVKGPGDASASGIVTDSGITVTMGNNQTIKLDFTQHKLEDIKHKLSDRLSQAGVSLNDQQMNVVSAQVAALLTDEMSDVFKSIVQGSQNRARESLLKANMRSVELAVESYAIDAGGNYPKAIDALLKSYFPHGSNGQPETAGEAPENPYTMKKEFPVLGHVTSVAAARQDTSQTLAPGCIQYSLMGNNKYAIIGADEHGKPIKAENGVMFVLSNEGN